MAGSEASSIRTHLFRRLVRWTRVLACPRCRPCSTTLRTSRPLTATLLPQPPHCLQGVHHRHHQAVVPLTMDASYHHHRLSVRAPPPPQAALPLPLGDRLSSHDLSPPVVARASLARPPFQHRRHDLPQRSRNSNVRELCRSKACTQPTPQRLSSKGHPRDKTAAAVRLRRTVCSLRMRWCRRSRQRTSGSSIR